MILVDTSVWVDHLRASEEALSTALNNAQVLCHPFVVGELACGSIAHRASTLELLDALPKAPMATNDEAMAMISKHTLYGRGIGWVDAHLLASTLIAAGCRLWTRDRRLAAVAAELNVHYAEQA